MSGPIYIYPWRSFCYDTAAGRILMPFLIRSNSWLPNAKRVAATILSISSYIDVHNLDVKLCLALTLISMLTAYPI